MNPSGKCSHERPTRGTVWDTMRGMRGADASSLAMNDQSLSNALGHGDEVRPAILYEERIESKTFLAMKFTTRLL